MKKYKIFRYGSNENIQMEMNEHQYIDVTFGHDIEEVKEDIFWTILNDLKSVFNFQHLKYFSDNYNIVSASDDHKFQWEVSGIDSPVVSKLENLFITYKILEEDMWASSFSIVIFYLSKFWGVDYARIIVKCKYLKGGKHHEFYLK